MWTFSDALFDAASNGCGPEILEIAPYCPYLLKALSEGVALVRPNKVITEKYTIYQYKTITLTINVITLI